MEQYPERPKFFSNKVIRLVLKTCAAQEIGAQGAMLVVAVAATEDAARYRRAVTWYDGQLMPILGIESDKTLRTIRAKCVDSGWLHYEPGCRSRPGRYWATIPEYADDLSDDPTDEGEKCSELHRQELPRNGNRNGNESGEKRARNGRETVTNRARNGNESGIERPPSLPTPTPGDKSPSFSGGPAPFPARVLAEELPPHESTIAWPDEFAEFLLRWQSLRTGTNGVVHIAGLPRPDAPGSRDGYRMAWGMVAKRDREAFMAFWPSRKDVVRQAMNCIDEGAIDWAGGREPMTIAHFANEIDAIIGGAHKKRGTARRRSKIDDIGDMLSDVTGLLERGQNGFKTIEMR